MKTKILISLFILFLLNPVIAGSHETFDPDCSGVITYGGVTVPGASVEVWQGGRLLGSDITDNNGAFSIDSSEFILYCSSTPCTAQFTLSFTHSSFTGSDYWDNNYQISSDNVNGVVLGQVDVSQTSQFGQSVTWSQSTINLNTDFNSDFYYKYTDQSTWNLIDSNTNSASVSVYQGKSFSYQINPVNPAFETITSSPLTVTQNIGYNYDYWHDFTINPLDYMDQPVIGATAVIIEGSGSCNGLTCTVLKDEPFNVEVSASGYETTSYSNTFTDSAPTSINLYMHGTEYTLDVSVIDQNSQLVTGSSLTITGADTSCTGSDGDFNCNIYSGEFFTLEATNNGYTTNTTVMVYSSNPNPIDLIIQPTLNIQVMDGTAPVENAEIEINNTLNQRIGLINIPNNNIETNFTYPIPAGETVNVYFTSNAYVDNASPAPITINPGTTSPHYLTLSTSKLIETNIDVEDPAGKDITNCLITSTDPTTSCTGEKCWLTSNAQTLTISKTGYYTNNSIIVPVNHDGSVIEVTLNATLRVNATKTEGGNAVGKITLKENGVSIFTIDLSGGLAWIPVDPTNNLNDFEIIFNNYLDEDFKINSISASQTTYQKYTVQEVTKMQVLVEDYYSGEEITDFELDFELLEEDEDLKSQVSINDDDTEIIFNIPEDELPDKLNITVSKSGYFTRTLVNQSLEDSIAVKLKPSAVIYLPVNANVTVINTKKSESTLDDSNVTTIESNNSIASLPLWAGLEFKLEINAFDYKTKILGPYLTTDDNPVVIGSETNPIGLALSYDPDTQLAPMISNWIINPAIIGENDPITVQVTASDEGRGDHLIERCDLNVDGSGIAYLMDSDYDDSIITASYILSPLSNGSHTLSVSCKDDTNGWSSKSTQTIQVGSQSEEEEDEDEDESNETITDAVKLAELRTKYELIVKAGLNTNELATAMSEAEASQSTSDIETVELAMPSIELKGGGVVSTSDSSGEEIASLIAEKESVSYSSVKSPVFQKTANRFTLNGEEKTLITLKVFSKNDEPNFILADFNPGESNAANVVSTEQGSITYFKGLSAGENVYEYVINGAVSETSKPLVFEVKEKNLLTGFTIGVPGLFEVPVIYLVIGAVLIGLVVKFLL